MAYQQHLLPCSTESIYNDSWQLEWVKLSSWFDALKSFPVNFGLFRNGFPQYDHFRHFRQWSPRVKGTPGLVRLSWSWTKSIKFKSYSATIFKIWLLWIGSGQAGVDLNVGLQVDMRGQRFPHIGIYKNCPKLYILRLRLSGSDYLCSVFCVYDWQQLPCHGNNCLASAIFILSSGIYRRQIPRPSLALSSWYRQQAYTGGCGICNSKSTFNPAEEMDLCR